jgi:PTS system nitrogen regulatory IIA component
MRAFDLLIPGGVVIGLDQPRRRDVLDDVATRLALATGIDKVAIGEALSEREDLGSTGVGDGVALPHAWMTQAKRVAGVLIRLAKPIEWDAVDHRPVDIVAGVVGPYESAVGLSALAALTRALRQPSVTAALRAATDPAAVFAALAALDPGG